MRGFKPVFIAILMLASIGIAHAEGGCPPGQYPQQGQGWQTCVPIPVSGGDGRPAEVPHVPSKWLPQWQAIATDTSKGILGTAIDKLTGPVAEAAALSDCKAKGGSNCRIEISYGNGCVAMVVGATRLNVRASPSKDEARSLAMAQCQSNDSNCHVYYEACSLPIEVPQ